MLNQISFLFFLFPFLVHANTSNYFDKVKWELYSDDDGIDVFTASEFFENLVPIRVKTVLSESVPKILSVLVESERKPEWLPKALLGKIVEKKSPTEGVEYVQYSAPWPIKNRDFLVASYGSYIPDINKIKISFSSTEHEKIPENQDFVRGKTYEGYILLGEIAGGTSFEMAFITDFKGMVPNWIINMAQKKWPRKFITGLKQQLQKEDIKIKPEFLDISKLKFKKEIK